MMTDSDEEMGGEEEFNDDDDDDESEEEDEEDIHFSEDDSDINEHLPKVDVISDKTDDVKSILSKAISEIKKERKKVTFDKDTDKIKKKDDASKESIKVKKKEVIIDDNDDDEEDEDDEEDFDKGDKGDNDDEEIGEEEDEDNYVDESDDEDEVNDEGQVEPEFKEDIYGRLRDKEGNIVKSPAQTGKYIPPGKRVEITDEKKKIQLQRLQKQIKGLVNR